MQSLPEFDDKDPADRQALALACAGQVIDVLPAVMDAVRSAMRQHIDGGLSVPQFRCLNLVDARPGISMGDVAAFVGVSLPTASVLVDRLARSGYLQVARASADRRRSELRVSGKGQALLGQMRLKARTDLAATLSGLSTEELQGTRSGLKWLRQCFSPPQD